MNALFLSKGIMVAKKKVREICIENSLLNKAKFIVGRILKN